MTAIRTFHPASQKNVLPNNTPTVNHHGMVVNSAGSGETMVDRLSMTPAHPKMSEKTANKRHWKRMLFCIFRYLLYLLYHYLYPEVNSSYYGSIEVSQTDILQGFAFSLRGSAVIKNTPLGVFLYIYALSLVSVTTGTTFRHAECIEKHGTYLESHHKILFYFVSHRRIVLFGKK